MRLSISILTKLEKINIDTIPITMYLIIGLKLVKNKRMIRIIFNRIKPKSFNESPL